mmetsp:Transcript_98938/g.284222  ORF Transcript_98938/g.284222 Transcript_98938/m.284222 type:complete len:207 (+) Transcript_98938:106-726(+)
MCEHTPTLLLPSCNPHPAHKAGEWCKRESGKKHRQSKFAHAREETLLRCVGRTSCFGTDPLVMCIASTMSRCPTTDKNPSLVRVCRTLCRQHTDGGTKTRTTLKLFPPARRPAPTPRPRPPASTGPMASWCPGCSGETATPAAARPVVVPIPATPWPLKRMTPTSKRMCCHPGRPNRAAPSSSSRGPVLPRRIATSGRLWSPASSG